MDNKIGIIGYAAKTGIGYLIKDYKKWLPIDTHYVIPHSKKGIDPDMLDRKCTKKKHFLSWLDEIKTLFVIEHPMIDLGPECAKRNIKIICSVNIDWFPLNAEWLKYVKIFIAPNLHTINYLGNNNIKTVYIPISIDTDYFKFTPRTFADGFTFNNGNGGYMERKNLSLILKVFTTTHFPLWLNSQVIFPQVAELPKNIFVDYDYPNRIDLYKRGSMYISPTKWEGHCLHILEAMACGMVPIVTDGEPMNEFQPNEQWRIKATCIKQHHEGNFSAWEFKPQEASLVKILDATYGKNIEPFSREMRALVEDKYSWKVNLEKFLKLL